MSRSLARSRSIRRCVLADEPTAHLDFIQVEEVLRLIRELASGERVVVVATHDHRMLPLADRVVELVPQFATTDRAPETVDADRGSLLFEQGTMGDLIYVVAEGELEIVRERDRRRRRAAEGRRPPATTSARSVRCSACPARRRCGRGPNAKLIGYTVQAFRERLGPGGVRDLIEHRDLGIGSVGRAAPDGRRPRCSSHRAVCAMRESAVQRACRHVYLVRGCRDRTA